MKSERLPPNHALQRTAIALCVHCFLVHWLSPLRSCWRLLAVAELGSLGVMQQPDPIEAAVKRLGFRRTLLHGDRKILVACLVPMSHWIPLRADWWHGKEVCIIGADLDGNFFLRHCDGTIRLWEHQLQRDTILAPSVRDFVRMIED